MTGQELKELRIRIRLKQVEMGDLLGISASAVCHIESGRNKMNKSVALLADKLLKENNP